MKGSTTSNSGSKRNGSTSSTSANEAPSIRRLVLWTTPVAISLGLSLALRFLSTVLAARWSPVTAFGEFATLSAVTTLASTLAMGGWPAYLLALIPRAGLSHKTVRKMTRALSLSCIAFVLVQSLAIALALSGAAVGIHLLAALLLVGLVFGTVLNEAQRASGNVVRSRFLIAVVPAGTAIAILAALKLLEIGIDLPLIILANAAGWIALTVVAGRSIRRISAAQSIDEPFVSRRDLMLSKASQTVLSTADVFFVGWLLGPTPGALYAVATRIAVTAGLGNTAVLMAFGPTVSRLAGSLFA